MRGRGNNVSATAADPAFQNALTLRRQGDAVRADAECASILEENPGHFAAQHLRGLIALERGDVQRGIELIGLSLAINPDQPMAYSNIGNALLSIGQPQRALQILDVALRLGPDLLVAHYNRGNALRELGRPEDALASYDHVLRFDEAHAKALNNRGWVLQQLGRVDEALECFMRVSRADPHSIEPIRGRATALLLLARRDEAAEAFSELLHRHPGDDSALENLWHLRLEQCAWAGHESLSGRVFDALRRSRRFINPLTLLLSDDPALSLECARAYSAERHPPDHSLGRCAPRIPDDGKLRVAYVSADFGDHPVAHLLAGVLERHDRSRFEVIGIALRPRLGGASEQRVHAAFDRSIDAFALSDRAVAQRMRDWGVDIAVDLMGFTQGSRQGIFAHRAAPIQASYLGYAGTMGAPYIDYLVADATVVPPGHDDWYSERIVRLPECYLPTDDRRPIAAPPMRRQAGLPATAFVYCAFTKAHKIHPALFAIWMQLLREAPHSVLWLRDMGNTAREHIAREAIAAGIDTARLMFAPRVADASEHLARFSLADLFLDTWPHNAHSTACEALWAGVPVITCTGTGFASRVAASALTAAGLPELVTHSPADYHRLALDLARQPQRLQAMRARLSRSSPSALFDTARYVRALESAYGRMHAHTLDDASKVT